jgi:hypothetical protein
VKGELNFDQILCAPKDASIIQIFDSLSVKSALVGKVTAPVGALGLLLDGRFVLEMLLNVLTRTVGGRQVAGALVGGDENAGEALLGRVVQALSHVRAPVEPLAQKVLAPALRVAQKQPFCSLLAAVFRRLTVNNSSSYTTLLTATSSLRSSMDKDLWGQVSSVPTTCLFDSLSIIHYF